MILIRCGHCGTIYTNYKDTDFLMTAKKCDICYNTGYLYEISTEQLMEESGGYKSILYVFYDFCMRCRERKLCCGATGCCKECDIIKNSFSMIHGSCIVTNKNDIN